jgi:U3 small nucleolar RNA-associated protein 19
VLKGKCKLISVFNAVEHDTKMRFLRVLDLSLRSATLPSKLIAAFIKRLARVLVSDGVMLGINDTMFTVALIANLIKRHPRCLRLVHRNKSSMSMGRRMAIDPFLAEEADPLATKALKSSLWELEIIIKRHYD